MIGYLEHHIVDHCNLNCEGCSHFSPLAQPWYENLEDFIKDFSTLADKSNSQIGTIRLMGGEPLLHAQVGSFAHITRELFPRTEIQIVTNGILLKQRKAELLPLFNQDGIKVCISNYGLKGLDLNEVTSGFNYTRIDWKQEMYHIGLTRSCHDGAAAFRCCDLAVNKWFFFQNGRFWPCCIAANAWIFNDYFKDEQLYLNAPVEECSISIHEHSIEEIEEFLTKPITLCERCDTIYRMQHEHAFRLSKKELGEWICP